MSPKNVFPETIIGSLGIIIVLGRGNVVMVTYMPDQCVRIDHRTVMGHIQEIITFDVAPELAALVIDGEWCMEELAYLILRL